MNMSLSKSDTRRWKFEDLPAYLKPLSPRIHPVIAAFEDFSDDQKRKILYIKSVIAKQVPNYTLHIFGSQIMGNWHEGSDYDIIIQGIVDKETFKNLRMFDYGFDVDLNYTDSETIGIDAILIPSHEHTNGSDEL